MKEVKMVMGRKGESEYCLGGQSKGDLRATVGRFFLGV